MKAGAKRIATVITVALFIPLSPVGSASEPLAPSRFTDSERLIVKGPPGSQVSSAVRVQGARLRSGKPEAVARDFLASHKEGLGLRNANEQLSRSKIQAGSNDLTHVRFNQMHDGVPVWGSELIVHMKDEQGGYRVTSVTGRVKADIRVPTQPAITAEWAARFAKDKIGTGEQSGDPELVVLPWEGRYHLAWHVTLDDLQRLARHEVFVGALEPKMILTFNSLPTSDPSTVDAVGSHGVTRTLQAHHYSPDGFKYLWDTTRPFWTPTGPFTPAPFTFPVLGEGVIATYDYDTEALLSNSTGTVRPSAVDAHFYAGITELFFRGLGRSSIDDDGISIVSFVDFSGCNAFWDGLSMNYGDGDCDGDTVPDIYPFSAALDVVAHELTHGVTQFSSGLIYLNQSGAMNEAYSDYFGNAIENDFTGDTDGKIGEDLCDPPGCPIRNIKDPSSLGDPTTMSEWTFQPEFLDNGGVHTNSTIYSNALWEIREVLGPATDFAVYRGLAAYLPPDAAFADGRDATLLAAEDLGFPQFALDIMKAEFDENEIGWDFVNPYDPVGSGVAVQWFPQHSPATGSGIAWIDERDGLAHYFDAGVERTYGNGEVIDVDVSGSRIVWSELNVLAEKLVVKHSSVSSGSAAGSSVSSSAFSQFSPRLDGDIVVWTESNGSDFDAWWDDLSDGDPPAVLAGTSADEFAPVVDGTTKWTAWENDTGSDIDIFTRELPTGTATNRTSSPLIQNFPSISGTDVVYLEGTSAVIATTLTVTDAASGPPSTIVTTTVDLGPASIDDGTVVFSEFVPTGSSTYDLKKTDVSGTVVEVVSAARGYQIFPDISGSRIVWEDTQNFDTDIYSNESLGTPLPAVVGTTPSDGATGVDLDPTITAAFSNEMDVRRLNPGTFTLEDASGALTPRLIDFDPYDGTDAEFKLRSALVAGRTYTATLSPPGNKVWDIRGNELAETTWSFTPTCGISPKEFMAYDPGFRGGVYVASGNVDGDECTEVIVGPGQDPGSVPLVRVFTGSGAFKASFLAYGSSFRGGVRVAAGDVDGDGIDEIVTSPGPGGGPHVRVWGVIGSSAVEKFGFMAYGSAFRGGVYVAVGNTTGTSPNEEIITGAGTGGGPHLRVFKGSGGVIANKFVYGSSFRGGVRVAAGNFDSDPLEEIVTGPGAGGGPHVRVWNQSSSALTEKYGFMAYNSSFRGGVYVAAGDVTSDVDDELIHGAGPGGGPHVVVRRGQNTGVLKSYFAYASAFRGGVRVAAGDADGDNNGEEITAPGHGGGPHIKQFE